MIALMFEEPIKESARERAQRIWRNNQIQKESMAIDESDVQALIDQSQQDKRFNTIRAKLLRSMKQIISNTQHIETIQLYKASLMIRKRKLLEEKLKRLEARVNSNE
jgi:hypothetical protein